MSNIELIISSFQSLLDRYHWDLWITITFAGCVNVYIAKKLFNNFLERLNKPNRLFHDKRIFIGAFFENNPNRDGVHVHVLLEGLDVSKAQDLVSEFTKYDKSMKGKFAGMVDVQPLHDGATNYIARKYAYKKLEDYDFIPINRKLI